MMEGKLIFAFLISNMLAIHLFQTYMYIRCKKSVVYIYTLRMINDLLCIIQIILFLRAAVTTCRLRNYCVDLQHPNSKTHR